MNEKDENFAKLTKTDMQNIVRGAGFFGSGGGGSVAQAYEMVENVWDTGKFPDKKDILLQKPMSVANQDTLSSVAFIGSPEAFKSAENQGKFAIENAVSILSEKIKKDFNAYVAVETGSINIIAPMIAAAITGKPCVDCTGTDRSVPKLQNIAFAEGGVATSPVVFANDYDGKDKAYEYIQSIEGSIDVDDIARTIISHPDFKMFAGLTNFVMSGTQMKDTGALNWITISQRLGESLLQNKQNKNIFQIIENFFKTDAELSKDKRKVFLLGKGVVKNIKTISHGGFDFANITIATEGDLLTVIALNENLLVWSSNSSAPLAMAPDLISYVDSEGQTYSNVDIYEGLEISLIGTQASERMRTDKMIKAFMDELNMLGYYGKYIQIENIK